MSKITYSDKEYIYENASIPEINKITDGNMNEIKTVINANDDRLITAEGEIDTAQTDINNAEAVIGNETDTYSASSTYALGSLVIYNSLLYKCTTAITVAEEWTIGHWTQVSLTSLAQSGDVYSTSEIKTNKVWIDGKPIYKKVIECGSLPNNSSKIVDTGIINENIRLVEIKGACYLSNGSYQASLNDNFSRINLTPTNKLTISTSTDFSTYIGYAILEYTKTTD